MRLAVHAERMKERQNAVGGPPEGKCSLNALKAPHFGANYAAIPPDRFGFLANSVLSEFRQFNAREQCVAALS